MKSLVPKLMKEKGVTAYALARDSEGEISRSTAYRMFHNTKKVFTVAEMIALCNVLKLKSFDDLFEMTADERKKRSG